jgi:hypothetical protein
VGFLRFRGGAWELIGGGIAHGASATEVAVMAAAVRTGRDGDSLFLTGSFDTAGTSVSVGFAEWRGCRGCLADCNRDGVLNVSDFGCFQTRFVAADPWADCNQDGALTVQDFGCFQSSFLQGCR